MMLSAATRFLSTMQEMLNPLRDPASGQATYQIDDIRQAMLRCLDEDCLERFPHVERRILMASNVPALWFLRPELLMVLAARAGEQAVGYESVEVRVKIEVFAEGVNRHDDAGQPVGKVQRCP